MAFCLLAFESKRDVIKLAVDFIMVTLHRTSNSKEAANGEGRFLSVVVVLMATVFPCFLILGISLTSFLFSRHIHPFYIHVLGRESFDSYFSRILLLLLEIIGMVPTGLISAVTSSTVLANLGFTKIRLHWLIVAVASDSYSLR